MNTFFVFYSKCLLYFCELKFSENKNNHEYKK